MPTISVVTPWLNGAETLLQDYAAAIQGANEVVSVDNGSQEETAKALREAGGTYIRNETNVGFAAANNQGYAASTGDIIIFLNSDVAPAGPWLEMVAQDVKDGALYGPSLQSQLVAGRWLPYIEGWCIAATRATWERLIARTRHNDLLFGPWNDIDYPGPYWEDNDLCFRAMEQGISLIQTYWPIQHKGGRTAGALSKYGASIEENRLTFTRRVQEGLRGGSAASTPTYARYTQECFTQSDIQHHLPLLYSLARGNVVELGTRSGVSTSALLAGVEAHGGHVWSVDIDPNCSQVAAGHPQWSFIQSDSRDLNTIGRAIGNKVMMSEGVHTLLVDSEHVYEITQAELSLWSDYMAPGGTILLHDTETFPGVLRAVKEFCAARGWQYTNVRPCNGMAVIEVPPTAAMTEETRVSTEGASWAMEYQEVK